MIILIIIIIGNNKNNNIKKTGNKTKTLLILNLVNCN